MNISSDNQVSIRNIQPQDFAKIQAIKPTLSREDFDKRVALQKEGKADFLTLEVNRELVSYVLLKWFGKPTHPEYPDLEDLYTKESARGKGYATLLIKECEKRTKAKGFTKLGMAANIDPECSPRRLYAKLGYRHDGEREYVDGVYNGVEDWCVDLDKNL